MFHGYTEKLKNKRVSVQWSADDGLWALSFKRLAKPGEAPKIIKTEIFVTDEAMQSIVRLYGLTKQRFI